MQVRERYCEKHTCLRQKMQPSFFVRKRDMLEGGPQAIFGFWSGFRHQFFKPQFLGLMCGQLLLQAINWNTTESWLGCNNYWGLTLLPRMRDDRGEVGRGVRR